MTGFGAGFFITYSVPSDGARTIPANPAGGSAAIDVEGLTHGAGAVLLIRDGHLATLEGYTYDEAWPDHPAFAMQKTGVRLHAACVMSNHHHLVVSDPRGLDSSLALAQRRPR